METSTILSGGRHGSDPSVQPKSLLRESQDVMNSGKQSFMATAFKAVESASTEEEVTVVLIMERRVEIGRRLSGGKTAFEVLPFGYQRFIAKLLTTLPVPVGEVENVGLVCRDFLSRMATDESLKAASIEYDSPGGLSFTRLLKRSEVRTLCRDSVADVIRATTSPATQQTTPGGIKPVYLWGQDGCIPVGLVDELRESGFEVRFLSNLDIGCSM